MDQVIGIMLVIVLIGLLTDKLLFAPWEDAASLSSCHIRLHHAVLIAVML
jgi:hypothetical protein